MLFRSATKFFTQAVQRDPRSSKARVMLGMALFRTGRFDEAGKEFQSALKLHPANPDAKTGLARVALQQHRTADAITLLEATINEDPEDVTAFRLLAEVYNAQSDTVKSAMYMTRAEEIEKKRRQ